MAEATVESPHLTSMFFCHECLREVQPNIPAYTCSRCNSGFIEELGSRPATNHASSSNNATTVADPAAQFAEMFSQNFLDPLRMGGTPGPIWGARHRYNTRQASSQAAANRGMEESILDDSDEDEMWGVSVAPNDFSLNGGSDRAPRPQTYHGIINYVIQRLSNDLGGGRAFLFEILYFEELLWEYCRERLKTVVNNEIKYSGVHLHANPGDYAWGTGGLDVIISQLLNQLEGTGAPPAQRETIDSLPKVKIQQSHIDSQLQCSICMDDFELEQEVHKLPCDHLYHSECIVRWLEMHGTCPVCRKDLNGEDTSRNEATFSNIYPSGNNADAPSASSSSSSMDPSSSSSFSVDFD